MLRRLMELQQFCKDMSGSHPDLRLTEEIWGRIEELVKVLEPARLAMKHFQGSQLTAGDFL
jgi:hypothetical protein